MYKKFFLLILSLSGCIVLAQSTEDFESETATDSVFTDAGQSFRISSNSGEGYNIFQHGVNDGGSTDFCNGCGWNGTSADEKFIDNSGFTNYNGDNNGTSVTIASDNGADFRLVSVYLFCSTIALANHSDTLHIDAYKDGSPVYSFEKTSGFSDVVNQTPNNGFTLIDMATETMTDYSIVAIDSIDFWASGDMDYVAVDAFTWYLDSLASNSVYNERLISIYPNPAQDKVLVDGVEEGSSFQLLNLHGQIIRTDILGADRWVSLDFLEPGVYILEFFNEGVSLKTRLIKE